MSVLRRASKQLSMLVCCSVAAAAGGVSAVAADSKGLTAPARAWAGACTYCHDEGVAPPLFGLGLAPAAIAAVVRSGLNGMPAFHRSELTDAQLQALAEWIAQQPASAAPTRVAPTSAAPTQP